MIRKILLGEDDPDDTDLFHEALKDIDNSIELYPAENGKEVLKWLTQEKAKPQLIFLDINMPEMDGWECLTALKDDISFKNIPVIMYSTSSASMNGKKAIQAGALCFLEKPPSFIKLRDFLTQVSKSSTQDLTSKLREIQALKTHNMHVS